MSQTPLLSIVAAVYNGEKFLAQFFECIEQQQLDSYELILVNDGSTDNSLAVIAEWQERLQNVQVLEQENQGVSVARNTGLAAASGAVGPFPEGLVVIQDDVNDVGTQNFKYVDWRDIRRALGL